MNRLKDVRNRRDDALTKVGWAQLELMLADYYRAQGWKVDHVGTGASRSRFDGGIDLKLCKEGEYVLVQAKHWNAKQVTHNAVHELLGIKVNEGATGAIVITSGEFTHAAREAAARQNHVELIDGDALRTMLGPQLANITESAPPPIPHSVRGARKEPLSVRKRAQLAFFSILFAMLACYGVYRLLTMPFISHPIDIKLPQRTQNSPRDDRSIPAAPKPQTTTPADESGPRIEQAMTGPELEEWNRKNAESMRILEENERAEAQAANE